MAKFIRQRGTIDIYEVEALLYNKVLKIFFKELITFIIACGLNFTSEVISSWVSIYILYMPFFKIFSILILQDMK